MKFTHNMQVQNEKVPNTFPIIKILLFQTWPFKTLLFIFQTNVLKKGCLECKNKQVPTNCVNYTTRLFDNVKNKNKVEKQGMNWF